MYKDVGCQGIYKAKGAGHQGIYEAKGAGPQGIEAEGHPQHKAKTKGKEEATKNVNGYKKPVLMDREGKKKIEEVELRYEEGSKPFQPARYSVPHHYQERLATHLRKLEAKGAVEHVADPTQGGEQGQGNHRPPEEEAGQVKLYGLPSRRGGPKAPVPQRGGAEEQVHEEDQPAWGLLRYLFFPRSYLFLSIMAILATWCKDQFRLSLKEHRS